MYSILATLSQRRPTTVESRKGLSDLFCCHFHCRSLLNHSKDYHTSKFANVGHGSGHQSLLRIDPGADQEAVSPKYTYEYPQCT